MEPSADKEHFLRLTRTPLLGRDREQELARALRAREDELRRLVLSSGPGFQQVLAWDESIRTRAMSPKELMPRGRRTARELSAMRRRVRSAARFIDGALARIEVLKRRKGRGRVRATAEILRLRSRMALRTLALPLHEKKVRKLRDAILSLADASARRRVRFPRAELAPLATRIRELETAVERDMHELVSANFRLVVSVAKRFSHPAFEFSDLVQEGTLGLIKGAERFDPAKGFTFSTYATWWIRQAVRRAIDDKGPTIRIPVHVRGRLSKLTKAAAAARRAGEREPPPAELARLSGIGAEHARAAFEAPGDTLGFSSPVRGDGDDERTLEHLVAAPAQNDPAAAAERLDDERRVADLLGTLSEREANVVRLRFGIGRERGGLTLKEVSRRLGVSRERVRQIERGALAKLRGTGTA